jgi:hypothetical protein
MPSEENGRNIPAVIRSYLVGCRFGKLRELQIGTSWDFGGYASSGFELQVFQHQFGRGQSARSH